MSGGAVSGHSRDRGRALLLDPKQSSHGPTALKQNTFIPAAQKVPDGSCSGVIEKIFPSAPYLERRRRRRRARGVERGWSW